MSLSNLIILKMQKQAYQMIFRGTKGMPIELCVVCIIV